MAAAGADEAVRPAQPEQRRAALLLGERGPLNDVLRASLEALVEVVLIDGSHPLEGVVFEGRVALPDRLPAAAAILRTFPDDADAAAQVLVAERLEHFEVLQGIPHLEPLNRRRRHRFNGQDDIGVRQADHIAHHRLAETKQRGEVHLNSARTRQSGAASSSAPDSCSLRSTRSRFSSTRSQYRCTPLALNS